MRKQRWNGPPRKASIPYYDIDRNMQLLVRTLNGMDNIKTLGCCGGHKNPSNIQRPLGHWFVSIWVYKDGKRTKEKLRRFAKFASITFQQPRGQKWFILRGEGDPRQVAAKLKLYLEKPRARAISVLV